mmetsp:Transcript_10378/g.23733  ORF Transcript_10378/g.23733 Transcript_10378/m.23733 type:complete len:344 (+) Transcript_10378:2869-3900(+)
MTWETFSAWKKDRRYVPDISALNSLKLTTPSPLVSNRLKSSRTSFSSMPDPDPLATFTSSSLVMDPSWSTSIIWKISSSSSFCIGFRMSTFSNRFSMTRCSSFSKKFLFSVGNRMARNSTNFNLPPWSLQALLSFSMSLRTAGMGMSTSTADFSASSRLPANDSASSIPSMMVRVTKLYFLLSFLKFSFSREFPLLGFLLLSDDSWDGVWSFFLASESSVSQMIMFSAVKKPSDLESIMSNRSRACIANLNVILPDSLIRVSCIDIRWANCWSFESITDGLLTLKDLKASPSIGGFEPDLDNRGVVGMEPGAATPDLGEGSSCLHDADCSRRMPAGLCMDDRS